MRRYIVIIGTAVVLSVGTTAAYAAAGAAFPNVDVRAVTPPGDVTQRQLNAQGTPNGEETPSGILRFILPDLYAPAPTAPYVATDQGQGQDAAPAAAPSRLSGNPITRNFLPGLQGNPAGEAHYGGMER